MLPFRIALRYLLSRKSHGAVNLISAVAMAGVAVSAAAMIVVLSVFNGFSGLVEKKTSNFNPPLMAVSGDGRYIADADSLAEAIGALEGVGLASPMITEQAFAISSTGQMPVELRAIPPEALEASGLRSIIIDGDITPGMPGEAVLSVGVAMQLSLHPASPGMPRESVAVYEPRRLGRINPANPMAAFRSDSLQVAAVYQVEQEEQDRDVLILPLGVARDLLDYTTEATAVAIYPASGGKEVSDELREAVERVLPEGIELLDSLQQDAEAYRMIAVEKWITFLMLLFILAVSSFNIISTLSLMIVEKQANIAVFSAMGAAPGFVSRIFAGQGWLITMAGGLAGIIIGALLTLGQQHFGWVKLSSANPALMAIDYYPVRLDIADMLIVAAAIALTSLLISLCGALMSRP